MKIYTKTGDSGETSLFSGKRVSKSNSRIKAYGTVDELNSFIGLLKDSINDELISKDLLLIQNNLFVLGSILASDISNKKLNSIKDSDITDIEKLIDAMEKELPRLKNFLIPGGNVIISYCQVCRTITRRTERICVELSKDEEIDLKLIIYLNRLSDYFFILSRFLSKKLDVIEIKWKGRKKI